MNPTSLHSKCPSCLQTAIYGSRLSVISLTALPLLLGLSCSSANDDSSPPLGTGSSTSQTGGTSGDTGGSSGIGGGETSSGGATTGEGSGGLAQVATGGAENSGGASGAGGEPSAGGSTATGGSNTESGGASSSGGSANEGDFFGESRCAAADLLLCDGFEADSIDSSLWSVNKSTDNTLELTSSKAARGDQSVHIIANNGHAFISNETFFPATNNDYFGRMFLRITRFSTVDWAHWTVAEGAGTGNDSKIRVGGQYIRTDVDTDTWANRWGVGSDGGETGDWTTPDQDPTGAVEEPAIESWNCVEWQHQGSTNETRFYLDGIEHPSLHTTAQDHGGESGQYTLPQMTSIWFGWTQYQQDPEPFEVWIDEVALDDERIGCSR